MTHALSRWLTLAAVILGGVLAVHLYDAGQQRIGEERAMRHAAESRALLAEAKADSAQRRADSLGLLVRTDTVKLTRWLTRYDTVKTALVVTDTDAVKRFVVVADSTIRSCRVALGHALSSCAAKDTVIAALRSEVKGLREAPPVTRVPLSVKAQWGVGGAAVGVLTFLLLHGAR